MCGKAKSQPRASKAFMDSLITNNNVGIISGKPKTGKSVEFFPALAEIADTKVKAAERPRQANSMAMAKRPTS